ncbi:LOW QUALITY PROTEIN: RPA-related protein RADX [Rhynchocyon petersi]
MEWENNFPLESEKSGQPKPGPSHAVPEQQNRSSEKDEIGVQGGTIQRILTQGPRSWIQKIFELVSGTPRQGVNLLDVRPVVVLAIQRYLLEEEPCDLGQKFAIYCYDMTISDGVYQEKCFLNPRLNHLVCKNILTVGKEVKIFRVSCFYNEKRVGQAILSIDNVHCGETVNKISLEIPFRNKSQEQKPERPLRSLYLALWNNEDPYGDIWLTNKQAVGYNLNSVKTILLSHVAMTWSSRKSFPALLVRILYKSKLRFYGKRDRKLTESYQTVFDVADCSGMVSVIMWNSLCPEWYKRLQVGFVILLQGYTVKKSCTFRMLPLPADSKIQQISGIISIISEVQVKEWKLPNICQQFITRSELDDLPENSTCDVVGVLVFVGRVQRLRKKNNPENFSTYHWIHIMDGTSEQPFIVKLFSTSQPEVFENIYPMTYFVCTLLKLVRRNYQVPELLDLTTTNESQMFIVGHTDQPYMCDIKVKNFLHWIKIMTESGKMKNTVFGGYYPYPAVPETFLKYGDSTKVESLLTALNEVRKEIEDLQYREHKRIAIQGIITVIKYVPHSSATGSASASETLWMFEYLHYSHIYPESIPRSLSEHVKFLAQQYNCQSLKYIPPEEGSPKLEDFKSACSIGHFEITILGLNHDIAIDVAFMPIYCPKDVQTSQIGTLLSCMNYSYVFPPEAPNSDGSPNDIIHAVAKLNKTHIIGILDICNLGNNKIEVCLHRIYTPEGI